MEQVEFNHLELGSVTRIVWGFWWRGIIVMLCSALLGGAAGGALGYLLELSGMGGLAQPTAFLLGIAVGAIFLYLYIRWLLSSNIGKFRLVIVKAQPRGA